MSEQQAIREDITPEKIQRMAHFDFVVDPLDSTMNALMKVMHYRKEYAKHFLHTGNEDILPLIEQCNKNIKLILNL
jgi:hypothetical protein